MTSIERNARAYCPGLYLALGCILAALGGCAVQQTSDYGTHAQSNIAATQYEMRLMVRSLVDPLCGQIENTADSIIASTDDRHVQLAALTWKIDAIPAVREALYQPDPITAGLDSLSLCYQMTDYFKTGPGKEALGPASAQAAETCQQMADAVEKTLSGATISGKASKAIELSRKWASEHPIQYSIAGREPIVSHLTKFLSDEGQNPGETIADVSTTLDDINRKLDVYSDQLVRQVRWEVQRFKLEAMSDARIDKAISMAEEAAQSASETMHAVNHMTPAMEQSLVVIESAPKMIASERERAINSAITNLTTMMAEQREKAAAEADEIAQSRIDYAMRQITVLVVILMGAVSVAAILCIWLVRRSLARRVA